jgi:hypothetical protein
MAEPVQANWWVAAAIAAALAVPWAAGIAVWLLLDWLFRLCVIAMGMIVVALLLDGEVY